MANARHTLLVHDLTRAVQDQFIIRSTRSGRTLIADRPMFDSDRESIQTGGSPQDVFRRAATYAMFAQDQPIYAQKVTGTPLSAYHLAAADALGTPQVLGIDIRGWTGRAGQAIRIRARDNVMVVSVRLVIRANHDSQAALEGGEAVQSQADSQLWTYTTTTDLPKRPGLCLDALAFDLPGNRGGNSLVLK